MERVGDLQESALNPGAMQPQHTRLLAKIELALASPWKVRNEVKRLLSVPHTRIIFCLKGITWGQKWKVFGLPIIQKHRGSEILIGPRVELRSWLRTNPLTPNHPVVLSTRAKGAIITIGEDCGLTGTTIVAAERVTIGDRVLLGSNVTIVDTDFHPIDIAERRRHGQAAHRPVLIGDDVFIGMNSLVMKGVTIGPGSVIGANSVVTKDVPPNVVAAGNPARIVRRLTALGQSRETE
jgi:acetyltransferase-like isoleucine patch superfamily enzyme